MSTKTKIELPLLTGSPKQIAWAESIRAKGLAAAKAKEEKAGGYGPLY